MLVDGVRPIENAAHLCDSRAKMSLIDGAASVAAAAKHPDGSKSDECAEQPRTDQASHTPVHVLKDFAGTENLSEPRF